jgi:hypothetical protein
MRMALFFPSLFSFCFTDRYTYMEFLFWVAYGIQLKKIILMSSRSAFFWLSPISSRIYLPLSNLLFVFS